MSFMKSFMKKYVGFWMAIDRRLGSIEAAVTRWETRRREAPRWQWQINADRPYQFQPGPSGKHLAKAFDVLYENRFSRWLNGQK